MFSNLETILLSFVNTLSLEVFVFVASCVEEIVAPIPSPTVMVLAGSFAKAQEYTLLALIPLALFGALGKTVGALVVYTVTDKSEDFVMRKFGAFFNVSHADVENLGKKLGHGVYDYVLLTVLRALPFMPSVVVSVGSGLLKVPLPLFIVSTFFGTIIRDGFYLYAGYIGAQALASIISRSSNFEIYIELAVVASMLAFVGYRMYLRKKATPQF